MALRNPAAVMTDEAALEHVRRHELLLSGAEGEDEDLGALEATRRDRPSRRGAQRFLEQVIERARGLTENDWVVRGH
ncbi:hypothetical protein L6V77_24940 [Myxococcota bacterium]|nr:hypothetical protein [Myxococcota bacterium]